jgi:SAM-dependent methyltransferase
MGRGATVTGPGKRGPGGALSRSRAGRATADDRGRQNAGRSMTNRDNLLSLLLAHIERCHIDVKGNTLVVGAGTDDLVTLGRAGFRRIAVSNLSADLSRVALPEGLEVTAFPADAEALTMADGSFDTVFAHEVLHHCASPHRALCEMLRVARRHVLILEPNESLVMSMLVRLKLSFPYELMAVVGSGYTRGGVRDSAIPNFIYRWSDNEVRKTAASYLPDRDVVVTSHPYWDLDVNESSLSVRPQTKIGAITRVIGASRLLQLLRLSQGALNRLPLLRTQGNKFFCCIEKTPDLKPWLVADGSNIVFNRSFGERH